MCGVLCVGCAGCVGGGGGGCVVCCVLGAQGLGGGGAVVWCAGLRGCCVGKYLCRVWDPVLLVRRLVVGMCGLQRATLAWPLDCYGPNPFCTLRAVYVASCALCWLCCCRRQEIPWSASRVTYKTVVHGLSYNQVRALSGRGVSPCCPPVISHASLPPPPTPVHFGRPCPSQWCVRRLPPRGSRTCFNSPLPP